MPEENKEIDWEALEEEEEATAQKALKADEEPEVEEEEDSESEKNKFGERAQKRIRRLVAQKKAAEDAAREAKKEAEDLRKETQELRGRTKSSETHAVSQHKQRLETAELALKADLKSAREFDDDDKLFEATKALARIESERMALETWEASNPEETEEEPQEKKPAAKPAREAPRLHPNTKKVFESWYNNNETWFGKDEDRTKLALRTDSELLAEGYDPAEAPADGEDYNDYFIELSSRLKLEEPSHEDTPRKKSPVSSGARTGGKTRKSKDGLPKLTQSEYDLAKRMGITPKSYAEQKKAIAARDA